MTAATDGEGTMTPDAPDRDITEVEIPDPQFGAISAPAMQELFGHDRTETLRWMSMVDGYRQTVSMLREQVAAWRAKYEAIAPKDEPGSEEAPSVADTIPDPVCADPDEHVEPVKQRVGYVSPYARNGTGG